MRLLILTQYFPPEVGAPQNRLFELALRLKMAGMEVSILTAMPNYPQMKIYEGYEGKKYLTVELQGLTIHRSAIFVSQSKSIIARLRNYFSFVFSSIRVSSKIKGTFDFLLCESPPLFLGYSALFISRRKKAKLIFNVSDLWPESAEKLGVVTNSFLLKMAYNLEAKLYSRATLVTGQTKGICENIVQRFPLVNTYWLPNGVDLSFYDPSKYQLGEWRKKNGINSDDFVFLYAGIIGIAQGLEVILDAAQSLKDNQKLKFVLLGSGPLKAELQEIKESRNLSNVLFLNAITKSEMPHVLRSVNAAIIPLKKLDLFKGAIPSKIFESLAMQVPILLGVDGEARQLFIDEGSCGIYFEPGNVNALLAAIRQISSSPDQAKLFGTNGRKYVSENFNREKIAEQFFNRLNLLLNQK